MKKLVTVFLFMFLSILLVACGGNDTVENERKILEERRAEREQAESLDEESSIEELMTPHEYAEEISTKDYPVEFDEITQTFTFIFPKEGILELTNEDNEYYSDEEYEQLLIDSEKDFLYISEGITDYYGKNYSTALVFAGEEEAIMKIEDGNIVENNSDMRNIVKNEYSEIDKEQYKMLGDYINIDNRNYVDNLEKLITDSYNSTISQEEFLGGLDKGYSELTYYCNNLLLEGSEDSDEVLSEDIGSLVTNSFLSCTGLKSTYLNFMITSSDGVAASEMLEESIEYFKKAKDMYDGIDI